MKTIVLAIAGSLVLVWQSLAAESPILPSLKGDLVAVDGKKVKRFDDAQLAPVKYYGIYYSASWCGPCKAFTPKLVSWYNENKKAHPNFELIFVSSDRSEEDMEAYMREDKMPWPALAFNKKRTNKVLTQYSGRGIPCLVLVDEQGKVLSHSYEGDNYVGPTKVLSDIERTLKEGGASGSPSTASATQPQTQKAGSSSFDDFFKKKTAQ